MDNSTYSNIHPVYTLNIIYDEDEIKHIYIFYVNMRSKYLLFRLFFWLISHMQEK